MQIAYLSVQVQQKDKSFTGDIPVSMAACLVDRYIPFNDREQREATIYSLEDVGCLIQDLRKSNLVVTYGTYCFDALEKYYESDSPMHFDFSILDLQEYITGQLDERVYLDTLGRAYKLPRLVTNGLSYINLWNQGKLEDMERALIRDVRIIEVAFDRFMTSSTVKLIDPRDDTPKIIDIKGFSKLSYGLQSKSFMEVIDEYVDSINIASNKGNVIENDEVSDSHSRYLITDERVGLAEGIGGVQMWKPADWFSNQSEF